MIKQNHPKITKIFRARLEHLVRGFTAALVLMFAVSHPAFAGGPFTDFVGTWKGEGVVTSTEGNRENIRCKVSYDVNAIGDVANINVNCASDSYRVNLVGAVLAKDGALSGSWEETTRQIQGDVSGRVPSPGNLRASLQTIGGGMELAINTNGKRQVIVITSQGGELKGASITLRRI